MRIFGVSRFLPWVVLASCAYAGVIFNPTEECPAAPAQGDITGVKCSATVTGYEEVGFSSSGTGSGVFSTDSVPFSYDFTVSGSIEETITPLSEAPDWEGYIYVYINTFWFGFTEFQGQFGQQMTGSFNVFAPLGEELNTWSITLTAWQTSGPLTELSLVIPNNSLDLPGTQGQQPVPEPAAIGLVGAGLLGLGVVERRRRSRQVVSK